MGPLLEVVLPVFFVIGAGYLAVWKGMFTDSGVDGLMRFTQKFALPCLLFRAIAGLDLEQNFNLPLLGSFYAGAVTCFVVGLVAARWIFDRPWEDCVAIGFCCLFSNSLLLGLPISERAFGPESLSTNFAIIAIHSPFCYFIGITTMEVVRNRGKTGLYTLRAVLTGMFSNGLIIGIALGFVVNLSGMTLPHVLTDAVDMMSRAALPAALFGLGGVLVRYRPEGDIRVIAFVVAMSLILHPTITWLLGRTVGLPDQVLSSAVITAAMAPGVNSYLFADMYGRARRVAASSVLYATGACVLTTWVWLAILG